MLWGGMGSVPHTEEQHAFTRRMRITSIYDALCMQVANRTGHEVTVRFTADTVWTECSCDWDGRSDIFSSSVVGSGRSHLIHEGRMAARRIQRNAYLDRLLAKAENEKHAAGMAD
jgi:hypothetical protein